MLWLQDALFFLENAAPDSPTAYASQVLGNLLIGIEIFFPKFVF
jgi:hypothetical protein